MGPQRIDKIYLHWTATTYDWCQPGYYHTVIGGGGEIHRLTPYRQPLPAHTYRRNSHSVALAIACMQNHDWQRYPPTASQITALCREVAHLCRQLGWEGNGLGVERVLTHAEAAALRDFPLALVTQVSGWSAPLTKEMEQLYERRANCLGLPHENYGPPSWPDGWPGGYQERWDLFQLQAGDPPGSGGPWLRQRICQILQKWVTAGKEV